jgi:hypothetical protein
VFCVLATGSRYGGGRPHILYNKVSSKYVLWVDNGMNGYQLSTSPSPKGPITISTQRALLDPVYKNFKPADFAIVEASKSTMLNFMNRSLNGIFRRQRICGLCNAGFQV